METLPATRSRAGSDELNHDEVLGLKSGREHGSTLRDMAKPMDMGREAKEVRALAGDEVRRRRDRAPAEAAVRACKRGGKRARKLRVLTTSTGVRLAWREVDEDGEGGGRTRQRPGSKTRKKRSLQGLRLHVVDHGDVVDDGEEEGQARRGRCRRRARQR